METEFTPITSLLGGALIGLSAVMLMATYGKIAGISGIIFRILPPVLRKESIPVSILFIFGLLLAVPSWNLFFGDIERQAVSVLHMEMVAQVGMEYVVFREVLYVH